MRMYGGRLAYSLYQVQYHVCSAADYAQQVPGRDDMGMGDSAPGTLGQMDSGEENYTASAGYSDSFEDEPPLLQELGIDFELIRQKVSSVEFSKFICVYYSRPCRC